ncbi:hypothetical protein PUN28_015475 [Cardiocondyla obscurior]|uniref:Uncharacterized protein n=1 Tax=Cardiocondyla obscurior TaxID=286306 RepID=A0AAW2EWK1_9HYME
MSSLGGSCCAKSLGEHSQKCVPRCDEHLGPSLSRRVTSFYILKSPHPRGNNPRDFYNKRHIRFPNSDSVAFYIWNANCKCTHATITRPPVDESPPSSRLRVSFAAFPLSSRHRRLFDEGRWIPRLMARERRKAPGYSRRVRFLGRMSVSFALFTGDETKFQDRVQIPASFEAVGRL